MILTSSVAGLAAYANIAHYAAAKHGVVGLMRALALELAPDRIRVNTIHPGNTSTPMFHNDTNFALFMPELSESERTEEIFAERASAMQALPVAWLEPIDMSNALLFLASDEARYITGVTLPVDAGTMLK